MIGKRNELSELGALLLLATFAWSCSARQTPETKGTASPAYQTIGSIERADPRLDRLIAPGTAMEKLAEGFTWSEGPVWVKKGGYLLFSDIPPNTIYKWLEGGQPTVYMRPSGYTLPKLRTGEVGTNGLTIDSEGRLVMCEHGNRRISREETPTCIKTNLVERYQGKRLNSPNDLVYRSNGDLYFTDPIYGLEKRWDDPERELDFCGVYRLAKDGTLTLLTKELSRPNGIAFSPDEKTLYVSNSDPERPVWMAYPVKEDGSLGPGRVFFDATPWVKAGKQGNPDGMKVDREGNLFATGPGGLHVFAPDGTHLGTLNTGQPTSNCAFGGDGSVLYITANMYLLRIQTTTRGEGF